MSGASGRSATSPGSSPGGPTGSATCPTFGLFYFTAASALYIGGPEWQRYSASPGYFIAFSLAGLALAAGLNLRGLGVGKWLHNLGAVGLWVPALLLMGLAVVCWHRFGAATEFTAASLLPSTRLKDIIFWSTIAFSLSGLESASMMGDEIENPRRNIPRALLLAGALITCLYILATVAMLVALPQTQILSLDGFIRAIETASGRVGAGWITALVAGLIVVGGLGQAGAWFADSGRIPFVAGIDRFLPAAFGRVHPRYNSPYVSLLTQAAIAAAFIFLGQAGTSVKGAYDVLVSMAIISYFIPYLFMFASMIRLQREPAGPEVIRVPGGSRVAIPLALIGLYTTTLSIGLALIPAPRRAGQGTRRDQSRGPHPPVGPGGRRRLPLSTAEGRMRRRPMPSTAGKAKGELPQELR